MDLRACFYGSHPMPSYLSTRDIETLSAILLRDGLVACSYPLIPAFLRDDPRSYLLYRRKTYPRWR